MVAICDPARYPRDLGNRIGFTMVNSISWPSKITSMIILYIYIYTWVFPRVYFFSLSIKNMVLDLRGWFAVSAALSIEWQHLGSNVVFTLLLTYRRCTTFVGGRETFPTHQWGDFTAHTGSSAFFLLISICWCCSKSTIGLRQGRLWSPLFVVGIGSHSGYKLIYYMW